MSVYLTMQPNTIMNEISILHLSDENGSHLFEYSHVINAPMQAARSYEVPVQSCKYVLVWLMHNEFNCI